MDGEILSELIELEREKPIHLVNARERGSRMLNVAHDESDWDVLFLFSQDASRYATIEGHIDSIHEPHLGDDEHIDLHGWNIDKFAGLLADSNPNAIEYCREDPTEYIRFPDGNVFETMAEDARDNFNRMALYYHYMSMAKRNHSKYVESGKDCTKGRQFYVARGIACARYIRQTNDLPPMDAFELAERLDNQGDTLGSTLGRLAREKVDGNGEDIITDITGHLYEEESNASMEPTDERISKPDVSLIDDFISTAIVR